MNTETSQSKERQTLTEVLKRFSLSYQEHQLVKSDGIGLVASHLAIRRRRFTVFLLMLSLMFAVMAGRAIFANDPYVFWSLCASLSALWCWRRHAKTGMLRAALDSYANSECEGKPHAGSLADDLRLRFQLSYDEHQAIHSGDADLAASKLIARCKANTLTAIKNASYLLGVGLLWVVYSTSVSASITESVSLWLSIAAIISLCVAAIAIHDRITIMRVGQLRQHTPINNTTNRSSL
ncbi:MAG: hypothetical protein R3C05_30255 [Pirellulaceae bacterium]